MHKIFNDRFWDRSGPAWHNIGHVDPKIKLAVKAVTKYGMDYPIELFDDYVAVQGKKGRTEYVPTGKAAIMRHPTKDDPEWRFFGHASHDYRMLQNVEIAEVVDLLTPTWPLETVGALEEGKTIFFTLQAPSIVIAGDEIKQFFLVTDTRDGGTSLKIVFTGVRTVCWNTLVTGLKQAMVTIPLTHFGDLDGMLNMRVQALKKLSAAQDTTNAIFQKLAKKKMSSDDFNEILMAVFPEPKQSNLAALATEFSPENYPDIGEGLLARAQKANASFNYVSSYWAGKRENLRELLVKYNDEYKRSANTLWAGVQVVVEFADWRPGSDKSESIPTSALWGTRATEKRRAFNTAMELLKK